MSDKKRNEKDTSVVRITRQNKDLDPVAVGMFIAENRGRHNLTQEELAKKIFISRKTVSKWENGRGLPSIELLRPLCDELNISLYELLMGEFMRMASETEGGITKKILNSPKFKISVIIGTILLLFMILCYLIVHLNDIKVYTINYEDKNFTIENGMILFSKTDCFINLGDFHTDLLENHNYLYEFYKGTVDTMKEEDLLLKFTNSSLVYFESESCKEIEKNLKEQRNDFTMKISYVDENGMDTYFKIDLSKSIKRSFKLKNLYGNNNSTDIQEEEREAKLEALHSYKDLTSLEEGEKTLDKINVEFLFNKTPKELIDCYEGKEIAINDESYSISYEYADNVLMLSHEDKYIKIDFDLFRLTSFDNDVMFFSINKKYDIEFNDFRIDIYNFILNFVNQLRDLNYCY